MKATGAKIWGLKAFKISLDDKTEKDKTIIEFKTTVWWHLIKWPYAIVKTFFCK